VPLHGYFIDLVVELDGKKYAIECDGSLFHQRGGRHSNVLLGNSEIKSRVIQNEGFEIIRIADEEWNNLSDKGRTLRKLLGMPERTPEAA
jgi:very-short-patch-repair endonuclease